MTRHPLAAPALLGVALVLGGARAAAQTSPPPAATEAPAVPDASYAPSAAPRSVRLHVTTGTRKRNKAKGDLYLHRGEEWVSLCTAPCTVDVPVGSELRATRNDNDEEPHTFTVSADLGPEVDLEIERASLGPMIAGIALMGGGGGLAAFGLFFVWAAGSSGSDSSSGATLTPSERDGYRTTGYVCLALGAAAAVTGLVLFLTRSEEPRATERPHREERVYGRESTLLGDVAEAAPRDRRDSKPAFAPLTYRFAF